MFKAYKYRIYPDDGQMIQIAQTFGCCRKIYNLALDYKTRRYSQFKQNVSRYELDKMLTFLKSTTELEFLNEVNSQALQQELVHLESAFSGFFKSNAKYPRFKTKLGHQSYSCPQGVKIDFEHQEVFIPKIKTVRVIIDRKFRGQIKTCTISRTPTGKYFIAILVDDSKEIPVKRIIKNQTSIGIDVGLKSFLVASNKAVVENPKFYRNAEPRIKCLQRRVSRKVNSSINRRKAQKRLALKHEKVANQRQDFLHKVTTSLIKNHDTVFVEDLHVKGMLKNPCLAKSIFDASWSDFFRMLRYKSEWQGKNVIEIGRFEPSSKLCDCGVINSELNLEDRVWICKSCGIENQRDFLAATNIKKFGLMKLKYNTYSTRDTRGGSAEMLAIAGSTKQKLESGDHSRNPRH